MAENLHLADLWVAVVPDTSKVVPAVDEAGKKAKTSFSQSVRGIGDALHDEISKGTAKATSSLSGVGGKIKDIFHKTGIDSGKALSDGFNVGTKNLDKMPGPLRGIADGASKASGSITGLSKAFGNLRSGDVGSGIDHLKQSLEGVEGLSKKVGVDISGWTGTITKTDGSLQGTSNKMQELVTGASEFAATFQGLPGKIGAAAGAMSKLGGEITLVIEGLKLAGPYIDAIDQKIHDSSALGKFAEDNSPAKLPQQLADMFGADRVRQWMGKTFHYNPDDPFGDRGLSATTDVEGSPLHRSGIVSPGSASPPPPPQYPSNMQGPIPPGATRGGAPITPKTPNFYHDWYGSQPDEPSPAPAPTPSRSSGGGGGGRVGGGGLSSRIGTPSSRSGVAAAGSRIANLYAFANSLVGTPYSQELRNDCSGMVSQLASVAIGLPPPAAGQRFSTPNEGQWLFSHGFEPGLGGPNDLNIGWNPAPGNSGHTAATLPGGINAESGGSHGSFLLGNGAAGASDKFFSQHAHLSMGSMSDSGGISGGQTPTGREHDPLYVTQTEGGSGGEGSSMQSQGQQLGQGLMNGVLQMFGIDGSVFGGKSPLDWGAVKLGGGLLNYGMGLMNSMGGGPMGTPGGGGGGGGGLLGGLAGLIPQPGPMVSAAAGPGGGSLGIGQQQPGQVNIHHDNSVSVTANGPDPYAWLQPAQIAQNAKRDPPRSNTYIPQVAN